MPTFKRSGKKSPILHYLVPKKNDLGCKNKTTFRRYWKAFFLMFIIELEHPSWYVTGDHLSPQILEGKRSTLIKHLYLISVVHRRPSSHTLQGRCLSSVLGPHTYSWYLCVCCAACLPFPPDPANHPGCYHGSTIPGGRVCICYRYLTLHSCGSGPGTLAQAAILVPEARAWRPQSRWSWRDKRCEGEEIPAGCRSQAWGKTHRHLCALLLLLTLWQSILQNPGLLIVELHMHHKPVHCRGWRRSLGQWDTQRGFTPMRWVSKSEVTRMVCKMMAPTLLIPLQTHTGWGKHIGKGFLEYVHPQSQGKHFQRHTCLPPSLT